MGQLKYSIICTIAFINLSLFESEVYSAAIWQSASHLGYAQSTSSVHESGNKPAAGSYLALDAIGSLASNVRIGWRTTGSGIRYKDSDTLRFTSGPMTEWALFGLGLQFGIGYFQESSKSTSRDTEFLSKGLAAYTGVVRSYNLSERIDLDWSAGIGRYWGDYKPKNPRQANLNLNAQRQTGQMRTIDFGIRISL